MKTVIFIISLGMSFISIAQESQRSNEEIQEALSYEKCKAQYLNENYDQVISYYDSIKPLKRFMKFEMYKMASDSYLYLAQTDPVQSEHFKSKSEQAYNDALKWYGSMHIQEWDSLKIEMNNVQEELQIVEEIPSPVGGMGVFYVYIGRNMLYPKEARIKGIEGRVYVQFVVNKDGSLDAVNVIEGIGGGCDEEAVRLIQNAEKWNPGKQNGEPVYARMILPVIFKLN